MELRLFFSFCRGKNYESKEDETDTYVYYQYDNTY